MRTRSPVTTGEDFSSPLVLNVQAAFPLAASTACSTPERSPTYTRPPATAGEDSPMPSGEVLYFHLTEPSARPIATSSPVLDPTYTTSSAMAAEDSIASPASYVHRSFSVAGTVAAVLPLNEADPRNCGQLFAGADAGTGACAASVATVMHTQANANDGEPFTTVSSPRVASASGRSAMCRDGRRSHDDLAHPVRGQQFEQRRKGDRRTVISPQRTWCPSLSARTAGCG